MNVAEASKKPCCTSSGTYKIRKNGTKVAIDPELITATMLERESQEFLEHFKSVIQALKEHIGIGFGMEKV